jgi:hypothetical protein
MTDLQTAAPEAAMPVSLADMSLAEYRAQREGAATPKADETAPPSSDGSHEPEESAAPDNADDTTEQDDEETRPSEEKKPARKGGFQRKLEAKEREIADLRKQLAERSAAPASEPQREAAPNQAPVYEKHKPKMDEFDSIEEFTESLTDWKADEREWKRNIAEQQQKIVNDWNSRKEAAQKTHADYEDVLNAASQVMLPAAHQRLFLESEAGAELAYQLAKDPAELQKFAAMDPLKAARHFGRLEAAYSSEAPDTATPRTSHAPRPIRPVGARSAGSAAPPDLAKLSLSDYRALRETGRLR